MLNSYQTREGAEMVVGILSALPLTQEQRQQVMDDILIGSPDAKRVWTEEGMTQDITAQASAYAVPFHVSVGSEEWYE